MTFRLNNGFGASPAAPVGSATPSWGDVAGKPAAFPPSPHGHGLSDIDGLQDALAGKQAATAFKTVAGQSIIGAGDIPIPSAADLAPIRSAIDLLVLRVSQLENGATSQAPAVVTVPSIAGETFVGSVLTRTAGTATGIPTPARTTQWLRNGSVLDGQTANSLDTTGFVATDVITTRDVWSNGIGSPATGTSAAITLTALDLLPIAATLTPNPPAAGQPFTVDFDAAPDSTSPNLTGTGLRRTGTGTAPASGDLVITATKDGYQPYSLTVAVVPAVAPAMTGGGLQSDGDGNLVLIVPQASGGYPEPDVMLTSLTRDGVDVMGDLDDDTIPAAAPGDYVAIWTGTNGVAPDATITRTITVAAPEITGAITVTGRTYAGQTPAAIPGIATATDTANYSSTGGAIVSAQLQVNGVDATTGTVLAISDVVSVLVTDDDGLTRRFVLSTVEYALRITPENGGAARSVEINDLIPGNQAISWTWEDVTTEITRDALAAGPVNHIPPQIVLENGDYVAVRADRWINRLEAGPPDYAFHWRRDGVAIAGATAERYTPGASDAGTDTTLAMVATDENGTSAPAISNAIANAAAPTGGVTYVNRYGSGVTASSYSFPDSDLGAPHASRDLLIQIATSGVQDATASAVTVAGIPATLVIDRKAAGTRLAHVSLWKVRVPTGATGTIAVTMSTSVSRCGVSILRGTDVVVSDTAAAGVNAASATAAIDAGTEGHKVFGLAIGHGSGPFTWTGGSRIYTEDPAGSTHHMSLAEGIVPSGGAASMTAARESSSGQIALIVFAAGN